MKRFGAILLLVLITVTIGRSQKLWTLEDCIKYALDNNIQVKRQQLYSESARNNYNQSMISVLPGLTAFANHDFNSGRALNYETYQWENREFEQGNMGIESRLKLFGGFQNYNNIQQQKFLLLSRLEDVESQMNDISIRISAAYFQILLDMEMVDIAERMLEATSNEMEAVRTNFQVGNLPRGRLLEMESQVAADEYQLIQAKNNLNSSYLDLAQIMQLDTNYDFQIAKPGITDIDESVMLISVDNIFEEAGKNLPQIRSAEYYLESKEREMAVIRGQQSPRLYLRGLFYSRYSELAVNPLDGGEYPYSTQIRDNKYRQLGISLTIPILDGWTVRNRISNSRISYMDANYQLDAVRQDLYAEIHQMHQNAINAYNRYNYAGKAALAAGEVFDFAKEQFGLGLISFVDYQYAQSSLFRAESNMAQAKYEYHLCSRIIDFYLGEGFIPGNTPLSPL